MNRYKNLIWLLVVLLIATMCFQFIEPKLGSLLTALLTSFTTIIGIFSVFYEMRRSADIEECSFLLDTYKHFTSDATLGIRVTYEKLDDLFYTGINKIEKIDRKHIVEYLQFFEMIASLVIKDVITIKDIDNLYAYPFFIGVNCKTIQDLELVPYKNYYEGIYKIYPMWKKYRMETGKEIPFSETDLIQ